MRKTAIIIFVLIGSAFGQVTLTQTTLSASVNANPTLQNFVQLASNAGVAAGNTILYVDREAMSVTSITPITNTIVVQRGQLGTPAAAHVSGATVFVGTPNQFYTYDPSGACTAALTSVTPWINVLNGNQWACNAGTWLISASPLGSGGLPSATAAGYFPVSTGAGTTYTGTLTPSVNGFINQSGITVGTTGGYFGVAHGDNSFPGKICGITAAGNYPPVPATGYGYAALDVCPALFNGLPPLVAGTSSRSIMGINSAIATAFPDNPFNVFAINGQLTTPSTYTGNQWAWYGMYHESDHNGSGTLHLSYSVFGAGYNNGNGICSNCIGGHFEAIGNFYGGTNTPTTANNAGLECNSGVRASATHTNDYCFHVLTPVTGGTFTNGHKGIQIDDQTNGGALSYSSVFAIQVGAGGNVPSGQLDWGANTMFVESNGTGSLTIPAPTGTYGTRNINWPIASGYFASSPCGSTKVFLNSDFTSANASGLQAITGLSCTFPNVGGGNAPNSSFECSLMYSQAVNVAGDQFGVSYTANINNFNAWGSVATNTGAATPFTTATAIGIVANTPTAVVTFQPANTGLDIAEIKGTIEPSQNGTFQLYVTNGTAADVIVVKRGSFCQFF